MHVKEDDATLGTLVWPLSIWLHVILPLEREKEGNGEVWGSYVAASAALGRCVSEVEQRETRSGCGTVCRLDDARQALIKGAADSLWKWCFG